MEKSGRAAGWKGAEKLAGIYHDIYVRLIVDLCWGWVARVKLI